MCLISLHFSHCQCGFVSTRQVGYLTNDVDLETSGKEEIPMWSKYRLGPRVPLTISPCPYNSYNFL